MSQIATHNLGFPRIGAKRELKKATEAYWSGKLPLKALEAEGARLRLVHWQMQKEAGIRLIPSNDFSFYDQMLDMSCLLGAIPDRFGWDGGLVDADLRFRMARGMAGTADGEAGVPAMEMTKWFDTNYHYMVPELHKDMRFSISSDKVFQEYQEALDAGIETMPVLIGPLTYLLSGKIGRDGGTARDRLRLLDRLLPVYVQILQRLEKLGAGWVQLDEPVVILDLEEDTQKLLTRAYEKLSGAVSTLNIVAAAYFGALGDNARVFLQLPVQAVHVDAVRGQAEMMHIITNIPAGKILSVGVVDGRNIWKNDFLKSLELLQPVIEVLGADRIWISPSCSLMHSPVSLQNEDGLDDELKNWLAFAQEKLAELGVLAQALSGEDSSHALADNEKAMISRRNSRRIHRPDVKARVAAVSENDLNRHSPYAVRRLRQRAAMPLPLYPTTTIGSFPQTPGVRQARVKLRKGEWSRTEYESFLKSEIEKTVRFQESLDIDVLVHGESERNDMVEYFGEQLEGFAFTHFGWVQSFGTRYVKPPIIFGDIFRPAPMTVRWSEYAQSLTRRPMKGMLTGPVTILQWSFVRDDQQRSVTCRQIALAIRDEVQDLEKAGIRAIQIDEPALREGLPLRLADRDAYLRWAVGNYKLATTGVDDATQIHTHMCYSEFNQIIEAIAALDTDVISIESSRSKMELLDAFSDFEYPSEIGPGIYDIHSPRIPSADEMISLLAKAEEVLPEENLWVNPDCGLKTRTWEEVKPALENMVAAAKRMREKRKTAAG